MGWMVGMVECNIQSKVDRYYMYLKTDMATIAHIQYTYIANSI